MSRGSEITAWLILTATLIGAIVTIPPDVVAGTLIFLLLAGVAVGVGRDLRPLWNADAHRVEDEQPTEGTES